MTKPIYIFAIIQDLFQTVESFELTRTYIVPTLTSTNFHGFALCQ